MTPTDSGTSARRPKRRPTQQDVARLAGVSVTLVSAVVSGTSRRSTVSASEETTARIWDAVRQLGYVPNVTARSLAGGRTRLISVFTYSATFPASHDDFHHQFFVGVEEEAEAQGYSLALITTSRDADGHRAIYGNGTNALQLGDGGIILGRGKNVDANLAEMQRLTNDCFPFVHVSRRDVPGAGVSYVAEDNYAAARKAIDTLVGLGHGRIGFVSKGYPTEQAEERRTGFLDGVAAHGLGRAAAPVLTVGPADILDATHARRLTAVVLETPGDAAELYASAVQHGVAVPDELSIISLGGWINHPDSSPRIAGFRIPQQEMGRRAVRTLIDLIADPGRGPIQEVIALEEELDHTIAPPPTGVH